MIEIRRGIAVRHYENSFFREFAKNLKNLFDKYKINGLLIANSECIVDERLQIDALLITEHAVCIIDFKNFGGKIIIPNEDNFFNGIWTNENGDRIKGGSSINPYKQLSIQKKKFLSNPKRNIIGIYEKYIDKKLYENDIFNPRHILRIVCFQNKIELIGEIPPRDKIDFFIVDKTNYLETIKDIIDINDKEINLSQKSFAVFKEIFQAEPFDLEESYEDINISTTDVSQIQIEHLYQDQQIALNEIDNFLNSKDKDIFILNGSVNSGKSHMIPYIEELAFKAGFQEVKLLCRSLLIANNLTTNTQKFNSLISYIYGGSHIKIDENNYKELLCSHSEKIISRQIDLGVEIIPLKQNDDDSKTLYIIDIAQLIDTNCHRFPFLQFGSGHILNDLLDYVDIENSNRKIVFIGDQYLLNYGDTNALCIDSLKRISQSNITSFSLVDKPNDSLLTNEALKLVSSIRKQKFNNLKFNFSKQLLDIKKDKVLEYVKQNLESNFKILVYSNSDAQKVNLWIKKSILKNGENIEKGDLIIFNNNINIENQDDPFAQPQKIYNGEFTTVAKVSSNVISKTVTPKGKNSITLIFREIEIKLENKQSATILSFENFRLNSKNELSEDEIIAYQILLDQCIAEEEKKSPFEKSSFFNDLQNNEEYRQLKNEINELSRQLENGKRVKTKKEEKERSLRKIEKKAKKEYENFIQQKLYKDTSSKYYKYKNVAWIKFGWALTVHKAISYKFYKVLINSDQGENRGITNEDYFRWLYTGLTRAEKQIALINYKQITPFIKSKIVLSNLNRKDFYYIASNNEKIKNNDLINKYNFPEEKYFLIDFYSFINSKIQNKIYIDEIEHKDWQEVYHFKLNNNQAIVQFYYNGKNQFKMPKIISSDNDDFKQQIEKLLLNDIRLENFDFVKSEMKENYIDLQNILQKESIYISYIIAKPYKDEIKFFTKDENIVAEFNYNGDGFFSKIELFAEKESILVNKLKNILENL